MNEKIKIQVTVDLEVYYDSEQWNENDLAHEIVSNMDYSFDFEDFDVKAILHDTEITDYEVKKL